MAPALQDLNCCAPGAFKFNCLLYTPGQRPDVQVRTDIKKKNNEKELRNNIQFGSVTKLCPTPCDPMDCSMPGFPGHHQLLGLAQTHIH